MAKKQGEFATPHLLICGQYDYIYQNKTNQTVRNKTNKNQTKEKQNNRAHTTYHALLVDIVQIQANVICIFFHVKIDCLVSSLELLYWIQVFIEQTLN